MIPYWQKDQLRTELKGLKKRLDDLDKARKAAVISEVAEQAKQMIADQPDQKYIVHEFKAGSNAKVRGRAAKIVLRKIFSIYIFKC